MRVRFLARANKWLLIAGAVVALTGLSDASFAASTRYLFDEPTNLKMLIFIDDHALLQLGRRAAVHWSDDRGDTMLHISFEGSAGSGFLYLCYGLSPGRESFWRENAATEPHVYFFDLKNGPPVYLWDRDKVIVDLLQAFDPAEYPSRRSTLWRVLLYEASQEYYWGIALLSHHGFEASIMIPIGAVRFLMACPVIPLLELDMVRKFILAQGMTVAGVVMIAASLRSRRAAGIK
ncbi:MAG: hypothetical protein Q8P50_01685 [Bacillota bacterium]|nr:hypothetical protein [Bacillota bacterium]